MFFSHSKIRFTLLNVFCLVWSICWALGPTKAFSNPDEGSDSDPTSKLARNALFQEYDRFVKTLSSDPDFLNYQKFLENYPDGYWSDSSYLAGKKSGLMDAPLFLAPVNKKFLGPLKELEKKFKRSFPLEVDEAGNWIRNSPFQNAFYLGNKWIEVAVDGPGTADSYYFVSRFLSLPQRVSNLQSKAMGRGRRCYVGLRRLWEKFLKSQEEFRP